MLARPERGDVHVRTAPAALFVSMPTSTAWTGTCAPVVYDPDSVHLYLVPEFRSRSSSPAKIVAPPVLVVTVTDPLDPVDPIREGVTPSLVEIISRSVPETFSRS